jgi:Concanavalin A-like lectin/glucanases superfamily
MRMRLVAMIGFVTAGLGLASLPIAAVPTATAAVPTSVVLLYRFDQHSGTTVPDSSSSHLNGTLVNVATPDSAYVPGLSGYGKALKLVASQRQYVAVPEGNALDVNRFTLAALVFYTGVQTADTLDRWEVLEKAGAYWMNIRTTGVVRAGGFFGACAKSANWKYLDSTVTVPTNTWAHVAATYNGTRLTIYVNGVAAGSMQVSGTTCANDSPLAVGAKNAPSKGLLEAFWDGQLDDVRIYNKALTATQIAALAP